VAFLFDVSQIGLAKAQLIKIIMRFWWRKRGNFKKCKEYFYWHKRDSML